MALPDAEDLCGRIVMVDCNALSGMEDVDYSRFPDREYQLDWLRTYLECYHERLGQQSRGVTPLELETLFVQVNKFVLVSIVFVLSHSLQLCCCFFLCCCFRFCNLWHCNSLGHCHQFPYGCGMLCLN